MKKMLGGLLVAVLIAGSIPQSQAAEKGRGGAMGFIAGCCFGARAASAYNEGKELHWRDWILVLGIPCIWDGIEGMQGMTTADYAETYGSTYY